MVRWARLKNWFGANWPWLALAAGFCAVFAFGFGAGYIAADQANRAPILIEEADCR